MKHRAVRLPVYENLYALNRDFEQVLADFARLQELGVFQQRHLGNIFRVIVQETRAWANLELVEATPSRRQFGQSGPGASPERFWTTARSLVERAVHDS